MIKTTTTTCRGAALMANTGKSTNWGDYRGGNKGPTDGKRPKLKKKDRPKPKSLDKGFGNG
jgi:hypothetical protein